MKREDYYGLCILTQCDHKEDGRGVGEQYVTMESEIEKEKRNEQDRVRKTEHKWSIWRCYADGFEDGENGYEKMHADSL